MLHKHLSKIDKFLYEHKVVYFLFLCKKYHPGASQVDILFLYAFIYLINTYKKASGRPDSSQFFLEEKTWLLSLSLLC